MPEFDLIVIQNFKVRRVALVRVSADTVVEAIEKQGESDSPSFTSTDWKSVWMLENEEIIPTPREE
jgi:hypothetical protein